MTEETLTTGPTAPTTEPTGTAPGPVAPPEPQAQTVQPESTTGQTGGPPQSETPPAEVRVVPKPSEYTLPEGMPDDIRIFAHENGMTQAQLDASIGKFASYSQEVQRAQAQAMRQLGEAHVKNWGRESQQNLALAQQAAKLLDAKIPGFSQHLERTGAGNDPMVLEALKLVGQWGREGGFLKSAIPRKPGEKTAAQAMYGEQHPSLD